MDRQQKITLGEMRESGPTRLLIYCQDYRCSHSVTIDASQWPDDVRLSDLEPKLICRACGHRGADSPAAVCGRQTRLGVSRPLSGPSLRHVTKTEEQQSENIEVSVSAPMITPSATLG
jgi:hypothetical protein